MTNSTRTLWLVIIAIAALLWLPHLLALGMFMDGVYDALLAQNLHLGISTFWAPQTIYYSQPAYWDNPPLAMGTLAFFYKIFGNYFVVERIYSLLCALLQLGLIAWAWRTFYNSDSAIKNAGWLPCLLFLVSPLISWCYSNNLLENTMALFTTATIAISLKYVQTQKNLFLTSIIAGALLLLAFITKGPTALFPLALPVLFIGVNDRYKWRLGFLFSFLQAAFFGLFFGILFSLPTPKNFLQHYLEVQVKRALTHNMPMEYKPFQIFIELAIAVSPFLLLALVRLAVKTPVTETRQLIQKSFWRFILLGLCGSVPIALSIKQRKFYLLPAMVPFAIGFAAYIYPLAEMLFTRIRAQALKVTLRALQVLGAGAIVAAAVLCVVNAGKFSRDADVLTDIEKAQSYIAGETVLLADWRLYDQWQLRGYLLRLHRQKLAMPDENAPAKFYLTKPGLDGDRLPRSAQKIYSGNTFDLYRLPG